MNHNSHERDLARDFEDIEPNFHEPKNDFQEPDFELQFQPPSAQDLEMNHKSDERDFDMSFEPPAAHQL